MGTIEELLKSELEVELEALGKTNLGSDDYKVAVDGITRLMDRHIEISKLNTEYELKRDAREIDTDLKVQQDESRSYRSENQVCYKHWRNCCIHCSNYLGDSEIIQIRGNRNNHYYNGTWFH